MKTIKVVSGAGVDNSAAYELICSMAEARGLQVRIEKARIVPGIQGAGVIQSAGIFIDAEQVHKGTPGREEIAAWLDSIEAEPCCGFCGGQGRAYFQALKEKAGQGN